VVLDAAKGPPEQALDSTGQWQGGADHARVLGALLVGRVAVLAPQTRWLDEIDLCT
jgi:hypothetical protein